MNPKGHLHAFNIPEIPKMKKKTVRGIHRFGLVLFKFIYLFIWLRRVSVAARGIFVAVYRIFFVACRIFSCSMQDL